MTHDEIMKLEAGRELDKLVAEHVMGWTKGPLKPLKSGYYIVCCKNVPYYWYSPDNPNNPQCSNDNAHGWIPPHYSTDIAEAWQVLEKLRYFITKFIVWDLNEFLIELSPPHKHNEYDIVEHFMAKAPTAPLAICRAALLAVMDSRP